MVHDKTILLAEGIYLLPGRRGGRYPHCNSLIVESDGCRAVFDPGSDRRALRSLAEEGPGMAVLSHFHSDHVRELKELPGWEVSIHVLEKNAVEGWSGMAPLVWFPEEVKDETWIGRKDREVGGWGWHVTDTFKDGDAIRLGSVEARVVHTAGHTPGHCSFWFPQPKILFIADIDLTDFGPWYGNAASSLPDFLDSIQKLKTLEPKMTVTGHEAGLIKGSIIDRLEAYAGVIHSRHRRILDYLATPRRINEIVDQAFIYGPALLSSLRDAEYRMIKHHLEWGIRRGEVRADGGTFGLV